MKKYSIFIRIYPKIISLTVEQINAAKLMDEIFLLNSSDIEPEEKQRCIAAIREQYITKNNSINNNLRLIKKDYDSMEHFYVFRNHNKKQSFMVGHDSVVPALCSKDDPNLVELEDFIGFSEKISREVFIDGEKMIAICELEGQLIVCKEKKYRILLVDKADKYKIRYGKSVSFNPKIGDIEDYVVNSIKSEFGSVLLKKKFK